ncbi:MAG: HD domain-containing protein [Gemmataceae bacterium]
MEQKVDNPTLLEQGTSTSSDFYAYRESVENWAEKRLKPYIERIEALPSLRGKAGKEINDAVWRTITLTQFEVLILDSPLMQRLRRVRQLGVVHWVYPGAGHSRLEHSLGALHQVNRLCEAINRHAGDGKGISGEWVSLLRLAALVHDIGHGLMSHVIENAFQSLGVTDDLRLQLSDKLDEEDCSLSEAAAYFILASDIFKELVDRALDKSGQMLPDGWQSKLCRLILGHPVHPRWPLLQELISGPFDADKLDYMSRDSQSAGIPNLTDIPRLIQKVRVAELTQEELPKEIGKRVEGGQPSYFVQGILLSGGRTLDELMIARTLLFDKIYRHQKTRAVEAMVSNVVGLLVPHLEPRSILLLPLTNSDEDFINLNIETITTQLPLRQEAQHHLDLNVAADLIARIRDRNLFVRAYAFSHTMPHDPFRDEPGQKAGIEKLRREFGSNPTARAELKSLIVSTTMEILKHAKDLLPAISDDVPLKAFIALDPFGRPTKMNEIARAFLVTGDRKLVKFKEDSAESPAWSNAYLMTRDTGYVFAANEYAPAVYLACEVVFRQRYGVRTPPSASEYSKVDKGVIEKVRTRLTEKGFYKGKSLDLCSLPERLKKADVTGIVKTIASKMSQFQPFVDGGAADATVDEQKILLWMRQFGDDESIGCAMQMLQAIRILTRAEVRSAIKAFLTENNDFRGCHVCQLGGPRDSSAIITYFAQDLADSYQLSIVPLSQALAEDNRPILFVDDFLGTGKQSVTIIKHWLGEPYEEQLEEDHGPKLTEKQANDLKGRQLGFVFVLGTKEGKERLSSELASSGIEHKVYVFQDESDLPRAFTGSAVHYPCLEVAQRFKDRCGHIGRQLLHSQSVKPEKIPERVLGYGNKGYLVAFPYNVPTATLTLIWSEGKVDGIDWMPLLPRRKKK